MASKLDALKNGSNQRTLTRRPSLPPSDDPVLTRDNTLREVEQPEEVKAPEPAKADTPVAKTKEKKATEDKAKKNKAENIFRDKSKTAGGSTKGNNRYSFRLNDADSKWLTEKANQNIKGVTGVIEDMIEYIRSLES